MKQFIVDRETTPGTPALDPVAIPKVPVYDTVADAEADLANLAEGQIIASEDTGAELNVPVDVVEEDNLHAVTSNAVAEALGVITKLTETPTVVGKWTDGTLDVKRAVLTIIISANNQSIMQFDLQQLFGLNITECVRITGCTSVATTSSSSFNFPLEFDYGGGWKTSLFYNTADHVLSIQRDSAVYTKTSVYYVWIEYV